MLSPRSIYKSLGANKYLFLHDPPLNLLSVRYSIDLYKSAVCATVARLSHGIQSEIERIASTLHTEHPLHPKKESHASSQILSSIPVSAKRQAQIEKEAKELKEAKIKELKKSYAKITKKVKEYDDLSE